MKTPTSTAFAEILAKAGYDNQMLALEITCGGVVCGPVWFTEVYGFGFGAGQTASAPGSARERRTCWAPR